MKKSTAECMRASDEAQKIKKKLKYILLLISFAKNIIEIIKILKSVHKNDELG